MLNQTTRKEGAMKTSLGDVLGSYGLLAMIMMALASALKRESDAVSVIGRQLQIPRRNRSRTSVGPQGRGRPG